MSELQLTDYDKFVLKQLQKKIRIALEAYARKLGYESIKAEYDVKTDLFHIVKNPIKTAVPTPVKRIEVINHNHNLK